jgi:hypothetical protein
VFFRDGWNMPAMRFPSSERKSVGVEGKAVGNPIKRDQVINSTPLPTPCPFIWLFSTAMECGGPATALDDPPKDCPVAI